MKLHLDRTTVTLAELETGIVNLMESFPSPGLLMTIPWIWKDVANVVIAKPGPT